MRLLSRFAVLAACVFSPAAAMAFVWPFATPDLSEDAARMIAMANGVVVITDVDGTIDADWRVEGTDYSGNEVELVIDGRSGVIEHAEMDSN